MFWIAFWKCCLVVAIILFTVMAVAVTIGGAFDVRRLLRRLSVADNNTPTDSNDTTEPNETP